jgi:hypothetical protein
MIGVSRRCAGGCSVRVKSECTVGVYNLAFSTHNTQHYNGKCHAKQVVQGAAHRAAASRAVVKVWVKVGCRCAAASLRRLCATERGRRGELAATRTFATNQNEINGCECDDDG